MRNECRCKQSSRGVAELNIPDNGHRKRGQKTAIAPLLGRVQHASNSSSSSSMHEDRLSFAMVPTTTVNRTTSTLSQRAKRG